MRGHHDHDGLAWWGLGLGLGLGLRLGLGLGLRSGLGSGLGLGLGLGLDRDGLTCRLGPARHVAGVPVQVGR